MGQKMLAACSGSLLTSVVVTPFDVVRVRLQQQSAFPFEVDLTPSSSHTVSQSTNLSNASAVRTNPLSVKSFPVTKIPAGVGVTTCCRDVFWFPSTIDYCIASQLQLEQSSCAVKQSRFHGTWDAIKKISQSEGLPALWRGLSLTLTMSVPSNVIYFIAYEHMRDSSPIKSEVINPLLCGGLARAMAASFVSPLELIKTRLQSARGQGALANVFKGVRDMVASQGVMTLWRGLVLTLWRDVPFSSIYWACVELVRKQLDRTDLFSDPNNSHHTLIPAFIAGSIGGTVAAIVTTPFDVGKTRRQIGHHQSTSAQLGMIPFMGRILETEGPSALFVGLVPRVLKVAPACAIMISSYELGKALFGRQNRNKHKTSI